MQAADGRKRQVMMHRRKIGMGIAVILVALLALAWFDGGRQEVRLIEQPVNMGQATMAVHQ